MLQSQWEWLKKSPFIYTVFRFKETEDLPDCSSSWDTTPVEAEVLLWGTAGLGQM